MFCTAIRLKFGMGVPRNKLLNKLSFWRILQKKSTMRLQQNALRTNFDGEAWYFEFDSHT